MLHLENIVFCKMLVVTFFPLTNHGMSGKPSAGVIEYNNSTLPSCIMHTCIHTVLTGSLKEGHEVIPKISPYR